MADGTEVFISQMSDGHLLNTMMMLKQKVDAEKEAQLRAVGTGILPSYWLHDRPVRAWFNDIMQEVDRRFGHEDPEFLCLLV